MCRFKFFKMFVSHVESIFFYLFQVNAYLFHSEIKINRLPIRFRKTRERIIGIRELLRKMDNWSINRDQAIAIRLKENCA